MAESRQMQKLSGNAIRQQWLDFFEAKGHLVLPSKSLVPQGDPSLLWINSGVATLKEYFTGQKKSPAPRLVNHQKSLRTNDIENVGQTARHLTLFEMLGNFSIGEYFKTEALEFAYELLFDVFKFDKALIYITYFDEDEATYAKWLALGIEASHLIKGSRKTNFWDVGEGPCGPCTEIFFDRGDKYDFNHVGLDLLRLDQENDRYIELWNIVFSQFNNDGQNNYVELKQKNIDTGAGLERFAMVMQNVPTSFDTDLFTPIIRAIEVLTTHRYDVNNYFVRNEAKAKINRYFRVIADHLRAATLAINDGALASSSGRGYIIRRLIRRAYRSGLMLGIDQPSFLAALVPVVSQTLAVFAINIDLVKKVISDEELLFSRTIKLGEALLDETLKAAQGELDFAVAFKLFETYGFPIELTAEIAAERGLSLDLSQRAKYEAEHAELSRAQVSKAFSRQLEITQQVTKLVSKFTGYHELETAAHVLVSGTEAGRHYVLLDRTPFYATGGGQEHDQGTLNRIPVLDVFKDQHGNHWHVTSALIPTHTPVRAKVDELVRLATARNHSATHLLGASLRTVFSDSAIQLGSDNNAARLRYDFPLPMRPEAAALARVEALVNDFIKAHKNRQYLELSRAEADASGAITLANEDYGDIVRVVDFAGISREFCGGTHVTNTGEIEAFKLTKFESKGAGIYRIEAITSHTQIEAYEAVEKTELIATLKKLIAKNQALDASYTLKIKPEIAWLHENIELAREANKALQKQLSAPVSTDVHLTEQSVFGVAALVNLACDDAQRLRTLALTLREQNPAALIVLAATNELGSVQLIFASQTHDANALLQKYLVSCQNAKGGGNARFAMASCTKLGPLGA